MIPRHFFNKMTGFYELLSLKEKHEWERVRWQTAVLVNIQIPKGKRIKPTDLIEFDWDKKKKEVVDAPPTYKLSSLDVVPESRIEKRDYKEFPIMSANDTQKVLKLALEGKIPMPMRSLANKYNISPFQLLVDTLEHYKDEEFYPSEEDKNFLLQKGNKLKGLKDSVKGMSPGDGQLSDATNYVAYVLSGTAPKRLIYRG